MEERALARRAQHLEAAVERAQPVGQPAQAGARGRIGTAVPVVYDRVSTRIDAGSELSEGIGASP